MSGRGQNVRECIAEFLGPGRCRIDDPGDAKLSGEETAGSTSATSAIRAEWGSQSSPRTKPVGPTATAPTHNRRQRRRRSRRANHVVGKHGALRNHPPPSENPHVENPPMRTAVTGFSILECTRSDSGRSPVNGMQFRHLMRLLRFRRPRQRTSVGLPRSASTRVGSSCLDGEFEPTPSSSIGQPEHGGVSPHGA